LFHVGIDGVKVKVFASSMDTPGRAELLGMKACQAYQSCCVCTHVFSKGPRTKPMFDGYRSFLREGSHGRMRRVPFRGHVFEYRDEEVRPVPTRRDDSLVHAAVTAVKQKQQPILGHKSAPLLANWPGFSWYRYNTPDLMHGNDNIIKLNNNLQICGNDNIILMNLQIVKSFWR